MARSRRALKFLGKLIGYGLLFCCVAQVVSIAPSLWRGAVAAIASEPDPGNPPFPSVRPLSFFQRAAVVRFPTVDSCVFKWRDRVQWETYSEEQILRNIAWVNIDTTAEAEVCIFRVLSRIGDRTRSLEWLEAQGFRVDPTISRGIRPSSHIGRVAGWFMAARGPLFRGALFSTPYRWVRFPYALTVSVEWALDDKTVTHVGISYNTL